MAPVTGFCMLWPRRRKLKAVMAAVQDATAKVKAVCQVTTDE